MSTENKKYFVKMVACIADEGDIIATTIVNGSDLNDYLNQSASTSFGNMDGSTERVGDIAVATEITPEEEAVLRKFNLIGIETGYFGGISI